MRSNLARSTLSNLPRSGRIAWLWRLRPCLAEPPALSPSTRNNSESAGSRSWQSASLPGREEIPSTDLRLASRALRAASRAAAASMIFCMIALAADRNRLRQQRRLRPIEPFDEGGDAALVEQLDALGLSMTRVGEDQPNTRIEEGELAKTVLEEIEIELGLLERVAGRQKG